MSTVGRIHSYESFGTLDGPGIRFVVFFQGCPLRCKYCHNPDTWEPHGGSAASVSEVMAKITPCRNFLRNGGVTLSGGEPLLQPDFALELLQACRKENFHTALDTAGSLPISATAKVIDAADLILLDIKALSPQLAQDLTGQDNGNELATLRYCQEIGKPVWIRHVLVPGYTMTQPRLTELREFLAPFTCIQRIELLPFHKMGSYKWSALGIPDPLKEVPEPTAAEVAEANSIFKTSP